MASATLAFVPSSSDPARVSVKLDERPKAKYSYACHGANDFEFDPLAVSRQDFEASRLSQIESIAVEIHHLVEPRDQRLEKVERPQVCKTACFCQQQSLHDDMLRKELKTLCWHVGKGLGLWQGKPVFCILVTNV